MTGPLPHDAEAEKAVLGRMLVRPDTIAEIAHGLTAEDFYVKPHDRVFLELVQGWKRGEPLDAVALSVAFKGDPTVTSKWVLDVVSNAPAGHDWIVRELIGLRLRRDVLFSAADAQVWARDMTLDPLDALDQARARFGQVDAPTEKVRDLWYLDEFVDSPHAESPWVIPGLFRQGWRAVVVAGEGRGKSWLSRQIAVAAASGIHPLQVNADMPPITTLIVDLENPSDAIADPVKRCRSAAGAKYDPERMFLWHRPQGIDLRTRSDRAQLEGVLSRCRPQFVALGPLYKAFTTRQRETDEQAAADVQTILDDLRVRYGFALLLEHHAPKAQGPTREMIPFGSSLWLRWPEIGIKLIPSDRQGVLNVDRWRVDRMKNGWPQRIAQGQRWPWLGEWERAYDEVMGEVA